MEFTFRNMMVRLSGESSNTIIETLSDWEEQLKGFEIDISSERSALKITKADPSRARPNTPEPGA
ncbi:hypothetical protein [uncultured Roseobacter sp.]|uniref:hypothetical protein n=1 Tax=uncultured Roseobacter sp. TaxID=114847 RepID=UPI002606827E|nr:hypothetical protein [uncultured Roseobacter sp.]